MILGLDLEGSVGLVTEVGLCDSTQVLSSQWNPASKALTKRLVKKADLVVGHNIVGFDSPALEAEGVRLDRNKVADTVVGFALLYPHHLKRLGASAPLCAPIEPGKHLDRSDPPAYSRWDAMATRVMWPHIAERLAKYGMEDLFWDIEMPLAWLLQDHKEVWFEYAAGSHTIQYVPETTGKGPYSSLTGRLQSRPKLDWPWGQRDGLNPLASPPGKRLYSLRNTHLARACVEVFSESTVSVTDPAIDLHLEGYGPVQINRRLPEKWVGIKEHLAQWDQAHPAYTKWVERIEKQVAKDGYIANPFGRRCWTRDGSKGRQFLVASTVSDIWKQVAIHANDKFYALLPDGLVLTEPFEACYGFTEIGPDFDLDFKTEAL